jgi:hypothetical protein
VGRARLAADQANAQRRIACLVFFDESALSLTPNVRRTWAPRDQTPTLAHPFNWKSVHGRRTVLRRQGWWRAAVLPRHAGHYRHRAVIEALGELRRFPRRGEGDAAVGRAAVAPQHRDARLDPQPTVLDGGRAPARLRACAPELNPVEGQRSSLKAVELANLATPGLGEVIDQPTAASNASGGCRTWPTRSSATPACRSHDPSTRRPGPLVRGVETTASPTTRSPTSSSSWTC